MCVQVEMDTAARDAGVFVDATCPVCLQVVSRVTPLRPCGHALCGHCVDTIFM